MLVGRDAGTFQCGACSDELRAYRGCSRFGKPRPARCPFAFQLPGGMRRWWDCPINVIPQRLLRFLRAWPGHEAGQPWYAGPAGSWPRRYTQAMGVIGSEAAAIREQEGKRKPRM
jgi:hypothetical protein